MTSPITGTFGTPETAIPKVAKTDKNQMDKDLFLKLLVAQLKYQDPTKPADATSFLAQTAQFTQVEKLTAVADAQQQMVTAAQMSSAANLVGRTVAYVDDKGVQTTGLVTAATISGSNPTVKVGNKDVPLSSVTEVRTTDSRTS